MRRFREIITQSCALKMGEQGQIFAHELEAYMQGEEQRDDITVLGFRL